MKRRDVDINQVSPMMKQYLEIKAKNEDSIVFFRLGDFYEMFFDDAKIAARELELVLTGKECGLSERVDMCGIPYKSYTTYLEKLINKGYKVAIVEQLEDPGINKGIVKRGVVQIVTCGTIIDNFLEANSSNYIASLYNFVDSTSFSYADISTGHFYTSSIKTENAINLLLKEGIKEVIVNSYNSVDLIQNIRNQGILVTVYDDIKCQKDYSKYFENIIDERLKKGLLHLFSYIEYIRKTSIKHIEQVKLITDNEYLVFDDNTVRNLELLTRLNSKDKKHSLFQFLNHCSTPMGARLLEFNLLHPLKNINELNYRYKMIESLLCDFISARELKSTLDEIYDLERIVSRLNYSTVTPRDLIQLKHSLSLIPKISKLINTLNFDIVLSDFTSVYNELDKALIEEAPIIITEGGIIKKGYNITLDNLRNVRDNSENFIREFEEREKARLGIKLKVSYNKILGYYVEITKANLKNVDLSGYHRKATLVGSERFINLELKQKEEEILLSAEKSNTLEYEIFNNIKEYLKQFSDSLMKLSQSLAFLDLILCYSTLASKHQFVKPNLSDNHEINIQEGKHPIIDSLTNNYVSNSLKMNSNEDILLITGPNMSGKSTYMREIAINIILAQMGSYVPAKSYNSYIFDRIFTRIGASDDLVGGDSTFMVEMKEASYAINNATSKSLIIFDELGRGTATYDGMALAQSIIEYIAKNIKCKTLFSTHYHELTTMSREFSNIKNVHVKVDCHNSKLTFLHKVENGPIDKSYGIHVASLAMLPDEVISRAEEILNEFEGKKKIKLHQTQLELFPEIQDYDLENDIKTLDLDNITAREALNILYRLKDKINKN